jgi:hypothetical protein
VVDCRAPAALEESRRPPLRPGDAGGSRYASPSADCSRFAGGRILGSAQPWRVSSAMSALDDRGVGVVAHADEGIRRQARRPPRLSYRLVG